MDSEEGLWQKSSVQSMICRVFEYVCLKVSGILSSICCLDDQIVILPNEKCIKFILVMMYRDTVDLGVSKSHATWDIVKPFFNQLRYINN